MKFYVFRHTYKTCQSAQVADGIDATVFELQVPAVSSKRPYFILMWKYSPVIPYSCRSSLCSWTREVTWNQNILHNLMFPKLFSKISAPSGAKVYYCIHYSSPLVNTCSWMNPVRTIPDCSYKIHINIFLLKFSGQNFVITSPLSHECFMNLIVKITY
jgi:hypothetical protein